MVGWEWSETKLKPTADGQKGRGIKQQNKTVAANKEKKIVWKEEGSCDIKTWKF